MFAASAQAKRIVKGQTLEGTVVGIGPEVAFIDVGGKGEATIGVDELKDADGALEVKAGDRIQAVVMSTDGGLVLSRKLALRAATERQLEAAAHSGLPVEGRVEKIVKGGFEVRIGGKRAFCPFSQIDVIRSEPATHEGRVYEFRITEFKEGGRNVIVSRRALLEEKQRAQAADVRRSVVPGAVLEGRVVSVRDFGAFVDLGAGVQGLLHVSEMGWSRVSDPSRMLKPGDEVTVKVLRIDDERIALGLKQLTDDPWATVAEKYAIGQMCTGRVVRIEPFGAFVELEPGVEALAHVSTFAPTGRADEWKTRLPLDAVSVFEVMSVDPEKRRIGVALVQDAREAEEVREYTERAQAEAPEAFGSLADKLRGALSSRQKR